jgi:hypothetical protein
MPLAMAWSTVRTMSFAPSSAARRSRNSISSGKLVAGLDVEERHRQVGRPEGLFGEAQEADGILAAGEEQRGPLELGRHLAHDVDGFGLQVLEMVKMVGGHSAEGDGVLDLGSGLRFGRSRSG